ncbi:hypothetical protein [Nocardioides limicola]|uniref:hypothetical protein n=1 Tax=Nocardioides limicola TaxID=2803368 RepID=UPI00193C58D5|nr:hypothetical protein [Nocardioides sp. DJM-14]
MSHRRTARRRPLTLLPHALLSLVIGLTGALTVLSQPPSAAPAPEWQLASQPHSPDVTVFTLNVAHTLNGDQVRADIRRVLNQSGGQIGAFQEFSTNSHRQALIEMMNARNFGYYAPADGNWGGSIPIVWDRARFQLIEGRSVLVHERDIVGKHPARHVNSVRLRELATGKVFGVLNAHTISGGSHDAQPHDAKGDSRKTVLLRQHLLVLRQEILRMHETTEHVVALGDLNVNYNADRRRKVAGLPTRQLGPIVDFNMPVGQASWGGKNSTSLLDYNMSVKVERGGGFQPLNNRIVRGFNSDHHAVIASYRPIDLFATGPLVNNPTGKPLARKVVLDRVTRVVRNTEAGAEVRIATRHLQYPPLYRAIRDAYARGVHVKMIVDAAGTTSHEAILINLLGTDTEANSFVNQCAGACGTSSGRLEAAYVTASRTGAAQQLVVQLPGMLHATAQRTLTDAFIANDPALYQRFLAAFDTAVAGDDQPSAARGLAAGSYRVAFRPRTDTDRDVMRVALNQVACRRSTSPRTANGRTDVFVSSARIQGPRGRELSQKLAQLAGQGCRVRVVATKIAKQPRKMLRAAGVPARTAKVSSNLLVVDGHYEGTRNNQVAWAGSQVWNNAGLSGEGSTLRTDKLDHVLTYRSAVNKTWLRARKLW